MLLLFLATSSPAASGRKATLRGFLVDVACVTERVDELQTLGIKHTRKCLQMPACDKSGFALLTAENKVIRFDDAGNQQARKLIEGAERERDFRVKVSGRLDGDTIVVRKLTLLR
ncbi:MAG: hypothetical protein M3P27_06605 [Acidobacteriota bacterium]|nr:hypothetical protein [Acidobacteriota bacterium]